MGRNYFLDNFENILHHIFDHSLQVSSEDRSVLITEAACTPKANRRRMAELMFETFLCPAMFLENQAMLALAACGRSSGLVLDIGEGISHCVPIYEGHVLRHGVKHRGLDGGSLTQLLREMMSSGRPQLAEMSGSVVRHIKEKLCYVAKDFDKEKKTTVTENHTLPDGRSIEIGDERLRCPEALFQPAVANLDAQSLPDKIRDSIAMVDVSIQRDLFANVVLSGGSTMFKGFAERLQLELERLAFEDLKAKVVAPSQRTLSTWIGGSVLSAKPSFREQWVRKDDYDEIGPEILQMKCF